MEQFKQSRKSNEDSFNLHALVLLSSIGNHQPSAVRGSALMWRCISWPPPLLLFFPSLSGLFKFSFFLLLSVQLLLSSFCSIFPLHVLEVSSFFIFCFLSLHVSPNKVVEQAPLLPNRGGPTSVSRSSGQENYEDEALERYRGFPKERKPKSKALLSTYT